MARPRASHEQHMRAYELHKRGCGPSVIRKFLSDQFGDSVVSPRTITTWVSGFPIITPETVDLDSPFQWHRLDEYSLPWEAGGYLLDMSAAMTEYWASVETGLNEPVRPPTVRQVVWWWRVHLAVPDATNHLDIFLWAEVFVLCELVRDVLGESIDLTPFQTYLAYGPWRPDKLNRYCEAEKAGRIQKGQNVWVSRSLLRRVREVTGVDLPVGYTAAAPFSRPEVLPSKEFEEFLESVRPLVAGERERREREQGAERRESKLQRGE